VHFSASQTHHSTKQPSKSTTKAMASKSTTASTATPAKPATSGKKDEKMNVLHYWRDKH